MLFPIATNVPHSALLDGWLRLYQVPLDRLVERSRRYERAYLAWETVRRTRNPFFWEGTGFEGYFVGINQSPDEMVTSLIEIGHQMLRSNWRLYRHEHTFKAKLMKTLTGELSEPRAIRVWSASLGASLGRLRCNVYHNYKAYCFQNETYWMVNHLPHINYMQDNHRVEQEYVLAPFNATCPSKPELPLNMLNPSDYDAGLVVQTIGCFGHPLIRTYLHETDRFGIAK